MNTSGEKGAEQAAPEVSGAAARINSADAASPRTEEQVQEGGFSRNPDAKVPSDLYPNPPGLSDKTRGAPDD